MERDFIIRDAGPRGVPAIDDECRDVAIVRKEFMQLRLDEISMLLGFDVARTDAMACVEDAEVQHHAQSLLAKGINILAHDIHMGRRLHGVVVGCFGIPDAETAMMLGGEAAIAHACCLCCLCPLVTIKMRRGESRDRHIWVRPVLNRIGGHVIVDEHAEAQVNKGLLQLVKRRLLSKPRKGCQQEREKKDSSHRVNGFNRLYRFNGPNRTQNIPLSPLSSSSPNYSTRYPLAFRGYRKSPSGNTRSSRGKAPLSFLQAQT